MGYFNRMGINDNPETKRAYQRKWLADRRNAWFSINGPCKRCGSRENLQLDHIDRTQKVNHAVWSWRKERRLLELAKCQVLCEICHRKKSAKESSDILSGVPSKVRKLSREQVLEIRKMMKEGIPQRTIAPMFSISRSVIGHISIGYAYADIVCSGIV